MAIFAFAAGSSCIRPALTRENSPALFNGTTGSCSAVEVETVTVNTLFQNGVHLISKKNSRLKPKEIRSLKTKAASLLIFKSNLQAHCTTLQETLFDQSDALLLQLLLTQIEPLITQVYVAAQFYYSMAHIPPPPSITLND
ncbi:MAG: hypothetical protein ABL985_12030 [Casimicrobium sp.]